MRAVTVVRTVNRDLVERAQGPDYRAVGHVVPWLSLREDGRVAVDADRQDGDAGVERYLRGAATELAGRRVGGRARPLGEDDDVDALSQEALGLVERACRVVVYEEHAADDLRVEEVSLGGGLGDRGGVRQEGDEYDDVDEGEVVGDDYAAVRLGEAGTVGRGERNTEQAGDAREARARRRADLFRETRSLRPTLF